VTGADEMLCFDCSAPLAGVPGGVACPRCGSHKRHIKVTDTLDVDITARVGVHKKSRERVKKNPVLETHVGEFRRGDGRGFVSKDQKIDRTVDPPWITKRVVDLTTGEVERDVSHPLRDHTDRGSAKKKK
jgi:hypothetical protein